MYKGEAETGRLASPLLLSRRSWCPSPPGPEILILLKLRQEPTGLTVTQLTRFLRKKLRLKEPKEKTRQRVHHILNKLEEKGFVLTETLGNYRFARITEKGLWYLANLRS